MKCHNCGEEIKEANFCPSCGTEIQKNNTYGIIGIVLTSIAGFLSLLAFNIVYVSIGLFFAVISIAFNLVLKHEIKIFIIRLNVIFSIMIAISCIGFIFFFLII